MEEKKRAGKAQCPAREQLSSWYDGEQAEGVEMHLANCPECRRVISGYERIDRAIKSANAVAPPGLRERIVGRCRRKIRREGIIFYVARAAAVVLIVVGLAGMVWQRIEPETADSDDEVKEVVEIGGHRIVADEVLGETLVLLKRGNTLEPLHGPWMVGPSRLPRPGVDRGDRLVSMGDGSAQVEKQSFIEVLPREVEHVWVVEDLEKSKEKLIDLIPDGSRCVLHTSEGEDSIKFTIWLADEELLELVNRMSDQLGWALVASESPQPGQNYFLVPQGRKLQYHCSLVSD